MLSPGAMAIALALSSRLPFMVGALVDMEAAAIERERGVTESGTGGFENAKSGNRGIGVPGPGTIIEAVGFLKVLNFIFRPIRLVVIFIGVLPCYLFF